ncbi:uncharacterized protein NFIA_102370 [Aspergillus fischeri NRRL 181]|uniref:Uncharacterized protein n=1 Tax=Neosartorya fischeri (strain ATCC 1020 / DSM 3700 / CBS 544.65 / FGSC A1164 / JCM 1740 / NRRL 181 / WB 181) TaxID=331117 RepID=A1CVV0_NEOFI|nr:uncharacterized protein NFIA_102370 [Aspergillus fischeri NRRL 181]EAW24752.1 hypothetical protein NFIA_102370 [Aspergillus fischeri NRRL 181]
MMTTNKSKMSNMTSSPRLNLSRVPNLIHRSRKAKGKASRTTWTKSESYCRRETHTVDSLHSLSSNYAGRHSILCISEFLRREFLSTKQ